MEGTVLDRAELVVRSLPITKPQYRRIESDLGEILFAYGKDGDGVYHGVWGVDQPIPTMRILMFRPGVTVAQVRRDLITNAEWWLEECNKRGLLRSGASFGKKY